MEPQFDDIAAELTERFDSVFDLTQESLFGIAPEGPHRDAVVVDSSIRNARIIYRAELDREVSSIRLSVFFSRPPAGA